MSDINTTENIDLVNGEWKHAYENVPSKSVTSLVSLYDLLYNKKTGKLWITEWDANNQVGLKLDHDIICYNKGSCYTSNTGELYDLAQSQTSIVYSDSTGEEKEVSTSFNSSKSIWGVYGIDIALPFYDDRAKPEKIVEQASNLCTGDSVSNNSLLNQNSPIYIYDKDSIIPYRDATIFTLNTAVSSYANAKNNKGLLGFNSMTSIVLQNSVFPPKVMPASAELINKISTGYNSNTNEVNTTDLILSHNDNTFESSVVIDTKNLSSYNYIFLNPYSKYTKALIYRSIIANYSTSITFDQSLSTFSTLKIDYDDATQVAEGYLGEDKSISDYITFILKNSYVWVRAPFFGDYIEPESYNQNLNQDSRVKHSGLMVSDKGDYSKYDKYIGMNATYTDNDFEYENVQSFDSTDSVPYMPQTTPTVDFITAQALIDEDAIGIEDTDKNIDLSISTLADRENFIINVLNNNSKIHNNFEGLPLPSVTDANITLSPAIYFDPERNGSADSEEYTNLGRAPTIIPKNTAYIDGRIISPTIDEIWYILKKLIAGRPADVNNTFTKADSANHTNTAALDIGIPAGTGTRLNDKNSTLTEVPLSEYNFAYGTDATSKIGDPVRITYGTSDGIDVTPTIIDKFVNQNNTIVYPIYDHLQQLSTRVLTKNSATASRITTNASTNATYDIRTLKPKTANNDGSNTSAWAPRSVPYSLRELEAMIMTNKFNLLALSTFIEKNYAGSSTPRTFSFKSTETNDSYGALFQYHKGYNSKLNMPNTYFNRDGSLPTVVTSTSANTNGVQATFDDAENIYNKKASNSNSVYPAVASYGATANLSSFQDKYSSSQVFMAADGTWRYAFEHVRVPILHSQF